MTFTQPQQTSSHLRRRESLQRARGALEGLLDRRETKAGRAAERYRAVARLWLETVTDSVHQLAAEEEAAPQVPLAFEYGPPLRASDERLFKGRQDIVAVMDYDLADGRRAPLWLFGQRRMGKSSLLAALPRFLGTGTQVVCVDFQGLSGHALRGAPHLVVLHAVAKALPAAPAAPSETHWQAALDWLLCCEETLGEGRLLLAVDDVEALEEGRREGWCSLDFLDFARAAGDRLRKIRLLLVSAYPLRRLGPEWGSKLISAVPREPGYLTPSEAEDLLRNPLEGFPNIYPDGAVERLIEATNGQPYLVQLVGDALVRRLNRAGRRLLTDADLEHALDRALADNHVFQDLWNKRTEEEQALLAGLARKGSCERPETTVLRELRKEKFVVTEGGLSRRGAAVREMDPRASVKRACR